MIYTSLLGREYDAVATGHIGYGYPDPDLMARSLQCGEPVNTGNYCNPDVDALFEAGRTTLDLEARKAIYSQIQQLLVDDAPLIFTFYRPIILAYSSRIEGVNQAPGNPYWNIWEWTLRPE